MSLSARAGATLALLAVACFGFTSALGAQATGTIEGNVVDAGTGTPLPSVQVSLVTPSGRSVGAATDQKGVFRLLNVAAGEETIRTRRIGYGQLTKEVMVSAGKVVKVTFALSPSAVELNAVVTTGTGGGQVEARKLGSTVATVQAPPMSPVASVSDVLQGREPGLMVLPSSGSTGEGARIRIRGNASLSQSNEPIVYVDGVRVDNGGGFGSGFVGTGGGGRPSRLDDIDPSAIEKVEVLKGAAAATLYGTEASNGVVLITTKNGGSGPPHWVFDYEEGKKNYPHDRIQAQWGFARSDTQATRLSYHYGFPVTAYKPFSRDVVGGLFRTGRSHTFNSQVSGGTGIVDYFGSLRTYLEDGPFTAKNFNWQNLGVNMADVNNNYQGTLTLGVAPSHTLKLTSTTLYTSRYQEIPENNNSIYAPYTVALFSKPENAQCDASKSAPDDPTYGSLGNGLCKGPGNPTGASSFGSERELLQPSIKQQARHFNGHVRASYVPTGNFNLDGTFGLDFVSQRSTYFIPFGNNLDLRENRANGGSASIDDESTQEVTLSVNGGLTGHVPVTQMTSNFIFGAQGYLTKVNDESANNQNFPAPGIEVIGGGSSPQVFESYSSIVNAGYFGQEQLGFHDWAFATGGGRFDYNSAFGKTSAPAFYPQASLSLIPSDRASWHGSFMSKFLSSLRFRAAVGRAGKQPGAFDKLTTYRALTSTAGAGLIPANLGNPDLKPEVSTEVEVGSEAGMLEDRISLDFTRWQRKVSNALYPRQYPVTGGFTATQLSNIGELDAFGWDAKVKAVAVNRPNVSADVYFNTGFLSQIVKSLGGAPPSKVGGSYPRYRNFIMEGYAPGSFFGARLPLPCVAGSNRAADGSTPCLQPGQVPFDVNHAGVPSTEAQLLAYLATPHSLSSLAPISAVDSKGNTLLFYEGKPTPDFEGSFGGSMTLNRHWRVESNLEYRAGHYTISDLTDAFRKSSPTNGGNTLERAQVEATMLNPASTAQQRLDAAKIFWTKLEALSPYDGLNQQYAGDFIRWRELSLTYIAPNNWASIVGGSDMRISVAARNFAMWTRYPGVDPELNVFSRTASGGTDNTVGESIDAFGFPIPRQFTINIRVGY